MKFHAWLREPLVHFLFAGAVLYFGAALFNPVPDTGRTIVIDENRLVASLQQRAQTTDIATVRSALAAMPKAERARLIHDTAADEALYREGRALGLDSVDAVVRLRTIQAMRQLLTEEAASDISVSDADIRQFYAANRAAYAQSASASFSHLFFAGPDGLARARAALTQLQAGAAPDSFGDRFLYQTNYADAGTEDLTGQFGIGFVEALSSLKPGNQWQGPIKSDHGWHLLLLRAQNPATVPPLSAITDQVRQDALAAKRAKATEAAVDRLLERYRVRS